MNGAVMEGVTAACTYLVSLGGTTTAKDKYWANVFGPSPSSDPKVWDMMTRVAYKTAMDRRGYQPCLGWNLEGGVPMMCKGCAKYPTGPDGGNNDKSEVGSWCTGPGKSSHLPWPNYINYGIYYGEPDLYGGKQYASLSLGLVSRAAEMPGPSMCSTNKGVAIAQEVFQWAGWAFSLSGGFLSERATQLINAGINGFTSYNQHLC